MSTAILTKRLYKFYNPGFKINITSLLPTTLQDLRLYSSDSDKTDSPALTLSHNIYGKTPFDKENPPIIILHDVFGSKKSWAKIAKTIHEESNIPVVTVDLRNHGQSPRTVSNRYTEMAKDVIQLYKTLDIEQANLLGHSMGGRTAMCIALTSPCKVISLLVEDVSPVSMSKVFLKQLPVIYHAMESVNFSKITMSAIDDEDKLEKGRLLAKEQLTKIIDDNVTLYTVLSEITSDQKGMMNWAYNLDSLKNCTSDIDSFPTELREKVYNGPTLFIAGDHSDFVPYGDLEQIQKMFPNAEIKYITHAGHNVHIDNPKKFLEHTIKFFSSRVCDTVKED